MDVRLPRSRWYGVGSTRASGRRTKRCQLSLRGSWFRAQDVPLVARDLFRELGRRGPRRLSVPEGKKTVPSGHRAVPFRPSPVERGLVSVDRTSTYWGPAPGCLARRREARMDGEGLAEALAGLCGTDRGHSVTETLARRGAEVLRQQAQHLWGSGDRRGVVLGEVARGGPLVPGFGEGRGGGSTTRVKPLTAPSQSWAAPSPGGPRRTGRQPPRRRSGPRGAHGWPRPQRATRSGSGSRRQAATSAGSRAHRRGWR